MDENIQRYYRILNVDPSASQGQITQAYRDLIKVWDPQRFANSPRLEAIAEEKTKEIIEAYHAILALGVPDTPSTPPAPQVPLIADHNVQHSIGAQPLPVQVEPPPPPPEPSIFIPQPLRTAPPPPRPPEPARPPEQPVAAPAMPPRLTEEYTLVADNRPQQKVEEKAAKRTSGLLEVAVFAVVVALILGGVFFVIQRANGTSGGSKPAAPAAVATPEIPTTPDPGQAKAPGRAHSSRRTIETPGTVPTSGAELIAPRGRTGAGRFRIRNESGQDAIIRVAEQEAPGSPLRLVYVRAAGEATISGIGPGMYLVSYSLGSYEKKSRSFSRPAGPFQFVQVQGAAGVQGDEYKLVIR